MNLPDKYRPQTVADILGQPWIVDQLTAFIQSPYSCAFLMAGDTGTGKSSAAVALARDLGIAVDQEDYGGFYQIASGEQTGESVRRVMVGLCYFPQFGSGWRMLVVNEADCMTPNAAYVWLDALESLPPRTVVVFTTNHAAKLPARLRDRCEVLEFQAGALLLMPACQELANKVWLAETGQIDAPDVHDLGVVDERGNVSFRRLLQALAMRLRVPGSAKADASAAPIKTSTPEEKTATQAVECDWQGMGRRYLAGESSHRLARECGLPETTVRGRLNRMGFRRKAVAA